MMVDAWYWLRNNQPESYEQLTEKLEQAKELLASSGQIELRQLVKVFEWCEDHGIELAELQVPEHLHKYREAAAYMSRTIEGDEPDWSKLRKMRETVDRIKSDPSRRATRVWARSWRGEKAKGHQLASRDGLVGLVVFGPSATVQRICSGIERFVDWTLPVDDALLSDFQCARQTDE
jgi:hypothetical protein